MKLKGIKVANVRIDKKSGKLTTSPKRVSISTRISKRKKPKQTFKRGK